jgi:integrase
VLRVRRPRVDSVGAPGLSRDQLREVLRRSEGSGARDYALVLLLAATGLRVGSALAIDVGDLATERGQRVVRVRGKGGRGQLVPLAPVVASAVDRLIEERKSDVQAQAAEAGSGCVAGPLQADEDPDLLDSHQFISDMILYAEIGKDRDKLDMSYVEKTEKQARESEEMFKAFRSSLPPEANA